MALDRGTGSLRSLVVFGLVGGTATTTYLGVTLGLATLGAAPAVANVAGIAMSLLVSYVGHHRLTFSRVGDHGRYASRFLACSAILGALSTVGTWAATDQAGVPASYAAVAVALGYPPASYLLNALWTFRDAA